MPPNGPASLPLASPLVVCVVLNWNGYADTIACVQSLQLQHYSNLLTLIVDNASTDDSVTRFRQALPHIEIIQASANRGFAAGCNLGTRIALDRGAEFVWLLNNDTVAPPDTLTQLFATAADPSIGIVGTVLFYAHNPTRIQAWGGGSLLRFLGYTRHFLRPTPLGPNSFLTFASVLLRREVLLTTGMLDEGYYLYFEDSDLCFRVRDAGWQLAVAPHTAVLHKEGGSQRQRPSAFIVRIVTASGLRFLRRHGRPAPIAMMLFVLLKFLNKTVHGDFAGANAVFGGVSDWWKQRSLPLQGTNDASS